MVQVLYHAASTHQRWGPWAPSGSFSKHYWRPQQTAMLRSVVQRGLHLLQSRLSASGATAWNSAWNNSAGGFCCGFGESALHGQFQQQQRTFVQLRTSLEVADNSGARRVSCIKVLGGAKTGKLGDLIIASVKEALPRGKVKKGEVVNCVIIRAAMQRQRSDGSEIRFDKNAVVIVNKQGEPIGTRIFGPVPHELRTRKFMKILTLADHVT